MDIFDDEIKESFPYVVRSERNNGVKGYIKKDKKYLNPKNTISFAQDTFVAFWQEKPYFTGNKIKILIPKDERINRNIGLFLVSSINKVLSDMSWGIGSTEEEIKKYVITLPFLDGVINFSYMEKFIEELEAIRIGRLQNYLLVTGLQDYKLTLKEEKALKDFENKFIQWKKFKIKDIFDVCSYKKRFDANKVIMSEKGEPYITRTSLNNGVKGLINEDKSYLNEGNTISFGQDTATMFYQEKPYFTGDKIKIMKPKDLEVNKLNAMFFITVMNKSFELFCWGASSFSEEIIKLQEIDIPVTNNIPDYQLMDTFISAIRKIVIRDVVLWVNKKQIRE